MKITNLTGSNNIGLRLITTLLLAVVLIVSLSSWTTKRPGPNQRLIKVAQKAKASIFKKYSERKVKKYFKEDYVQHNPNVPTGRAPIIGLLPTLKEKGITYTTHRVFQDDNFVVMHNSFINAERLGDGLKINVTF